MLPSHDVVPSTQVVMFSESVPRSVSIQGPSGSRQPSFGTGPLAVLSRSRAVRSLATEAEDDCARAHGGTDLATYGRDNDGEFTSALTASGVLGRSRVAGPITVLGRREESAGRRAPRPLRSLQSPWSGGMIEASRRT